MPVISSFYGIIILMYHEKDVGRNTPHFHARYSGTNASIDFDGNILAGSLPNKQAAIVKAWALLHREELEANWELAMNKTELYKIEPLR